MRSALLMVLLFSSIGASADSFTTSVTLSDGFSPDGSQMQFFSDYFGGVLGKSPEMDVYRFDGTAFNFNLSYALPANAIITAAGLTFSQTSNFRIDTSSHTGPLDLVGEEVGCTTPPCPFSGGAGYAEGYVNAYVIADVGGQQLVLPWWYDFTYTPMPDGDATKVLSSTTSITYDLLGIDSLVLQTSQVLPISGEANLLTILDYWSFGKGAWTTIDLATAYNQSLTATLQLDYTVPVPEPATVSLLLIGLVAGHRRLRHR